MTRNRYARRRYISRKGMVPLRYAWSSCFYKTGELPLIATCEVAAFSRKVHGPVIAARGDDACQRVAIAGHESINV